jgi:outer membrane protein OmpA-like peptidoglycan-associated protein
MYGSSIRAMIAPITFLLLAACAAGEPPRQQAQPTVPFNPPSTAILALPASQVTWHHVSFGTSGYEIGAEGQQIIRDVADTLQGNPALVATIVGKTDAVGSDAANMRLSQRRAAAVREALISTGKVQPSRLELKWTGERQQSVPTGNDVSAERNRAVDIAVHRTGN